MNLQETRRQCVDFSTFPKLITLNLGLIGDTPPCLCHEELGVNYKARWSNAATSRLPLADPIRYDLVNPNR